MMKFFTCGCCSSTTTVPDGYENSGIDYISAPKRVRDRCWFKALMWSFVIIFWLSLFSFIFIFVAVPIWFQNDINFQRKIMFLDIDDIDNPEYNNIQKYHITGVRNFYIKVEDNREYVSLGVWQIVPEDQIEASKDPLFNYEWALATSKKPILIFFHGQAATRISNVAKYKVLRKFFHILAFDYRNFADSSEFVLSEKDVVNDSVKLYADILGRTMQQEIYIWGHSLGTALGTRTARELFKSKIPIKPKGLFLESAFSTIREEIPENPLGKVFKWLPWFEATILDPLERNDFHFATTTNILYVECPIFIIHADDDNIIPTRLSKKVYEASKNRTGWTIEEYHLVPSSYGLKHTNIEEYPPLPSLIEDFLQKTRQTIL